MDTYLSSGNVELLKRDRQKRNGKLKLQQTRTACGRHQSVSQITAAQS